MSKPKACRSTIKTATPVATDPVALQRRKTTSRLRRARQGLEAFAFRLESLHADKTGCARAYYGATVPIVAYEAEGKLKGIARTKREAVNGCDQCAAWLEETADLRQRIEDLRNKPLPAKDPSYTGWPLSLSAVNAIGKARPRNYLDGVPRPDVATLLAEREARTLERKARGTAFLQDFLGDMEEAAEAKAAANVPH